MQASRVIYSGKTRYQEVDIIESPDLGKCLIIDGAVQSTTFDEYIYHESLVHPAMLTTKDPKNVLVIGGGEGATAREILKYNIQKIKVIDLDEELIELCKEHLEEMHKGSFYDERAEVIFTDGMKFIEDSDEKYDVIIIDVTDPTEGTSQQLYTKEFYSLIRDRLSEGGCMVTQATSPQFSTNCFTIIHNTLEQVFKYVRAYQAPVRSYGGLWGFVIASNYNDPLYAHNNFGRLDGKELSFYDDETHKGLFALGRKLKRMLDEEKRVATRDNMIYMPAMPR